MSSRHVPALDGVRGLAAFVVLVHHAWPIQATQFGWTGVDLFFVLSGYLITGILLDVRDQADRWPHFYIRRALRILPLYYGLLIVCFVVIPIVHPPHTAEYAALTRHQVWYWTYLSNWGSGLFWHDSPDPLYHLWSLAIEEQFYLLWPFMVWHLSPRHLLRVAVGAIVGALVLRTILLASGAGPWPAYLLTPCRLDGLAAGAMLAIVARSPGGLRAALPTIRGTALIGVSVLVAVLISQVVRGLSPFDWDPAMQTVGYPAIAASFAGLLVAALGPLNGLFSLAPLRWLGRYSYGLYVYHPLVMLYLRRKTPLQIRTVEFFIVASALSMLLAWASYEGYERWFLRLKDRLFVKVEERGLPDASPVLPDVGIGGAVVGGHLEGTVDGP